MKKAVLILSAIVLLSVFSKRTQAQFIATLSIDSVIGLPDTLNANTSYSFGFLLRNVGNTLYSGSINFDFLVDSMIPGTQQSFGAGQVGSFAPDDTALITVTYNFSINNNTFNIGDNVVVVAANLTNTYGGEFDLSESALGDGTWHEVVHGYDLQVVGGHLVDTLAEGEAKIYRRVT